MHRLLLKIALPLLLATSATPALAHWKYDSFTADGITYTTKTWGKTMYLYINGSKSTLEGDDYLSAVSITNIGALGEVVKVRSSFKDTSSGNTSIGNGGCGAATGAGGAAALCVEGSKNLSLNGTKAIRIDFKNDIKPVKPEFTLTLVDKVKDEQGELYNVSFGTKTGSYANNSGSNSGGGNGNGGSNGNGNGGTTTPVDMPNPNPPTPPVNPVDPELIPPTTNPQPPVTIPVDQPNLPGNGGAPSDVPEPQSMLLMAAGMAALMLMRRRQTRK